MTSELTRNVCPAVKPTRLAVLAISVSVLVAACGSSNPTAAPTAAPTHRPPPALETFKELLTVEDVQGVVSFPVTLTDVHDFRAKAASVDPSHVETIDPWLGLSFRQTGGAQWISFTALDFDTLDGARTHFDRVRSDDRLELMEDSSCEDWAAAEPNAQGIGAIVAFLKEDKVVTLHSVMPVGQGNTLVNLKGLLELALKVERRL